jgi:hypothetical protein
MSDWTSTISVGHGTPHAEANARKLWVGGAASAVVAGLVALVGGPNQPLAVRSSAPYDRISRH